MKFKWKNKMLILGASVLSLGTIVGVGTSSLVYKNNINYVSVLNKKLNDIQQNTSVPYNGDFYMYYDCVSKTTYEYDELPSDTTNMTLTEWHIIIGMVANTQNILTLSITPINLDQNTYNQYFQGDDWVQPFTDYINNALVEFFNTKQLNNQPMFDLSIYNLWIQFSWNTQSNSYNTNTTFNVTNNYLNDLNNEIEKNKDNENKINDLNNETNKQSSMLNNQINNLEIGLIVVVAVIVIICGFIGWYVLHKKYKKQKVEKTKLKENLLLYSNNIKH